MIIRTMCLSGSNHNKGSLLEQMGGASRPASKCIDGVPLFQALWLECEKSMELIASSSRSCLFWSGGQSKDETTLSESVPTGAQRKEQ